MFAGGDHVPFGDQPHQFAAGDPHAAVNGGAAAGVESLVRFGDRGIDQVHGDLGALVFGYDPTHRFAGFQAIGSGNQDIFAFVVLDQFSAGVALGPAGLLDVQRDVLGNALAHGVDIDIIGHQETPCRYVGGAGPGSPVVPCIGPEIRFPLVVTQFVAQGFVFAFADIGQVGAECTGSCIFVKIDRDLEFLANAAPHALRYGDAFFHGYSAHRNEGADVGRSMPGVGSRVLAHIDQFGGAFNHPKGRFGHARGVADKSNHRAVGFGAGIHVQQMHSVDFTDDRGHGVDDSLIPSLADIGNTFDELIHGGDLAIRADGSELIILKIVRWGWEFQLSGYDPGNGTPGRVIKTCNLAAPDASSILAAVVEPVPRRAFSADPVIQTNL